MIIHIKLTEQLRRKILADLVRVHPFAAERVGFICCKPSETKSSVLIVATEYLTVDDNDYIPDDSVGAMMGRSAISNALQAAYGKSTSMLHVHLHGHDGVPRFSTTDLRETANFVPDFFNVQPSLPHGALVLSNDSAIARCWMRSDAMPTWAAKITFVGKPITFIETS